MVPNVSAVYGAISACPEGYIVTRAGAVTAPEQMAAWHLYRRKVICIV